MGNTPEIPRRIAQDLSGLILDPETPRFNAPLENFGPKDGTQQQIKVYRDTRQKLLPLEIALQSIISECLEGAKKRRGRNVYDSTIVTNAGDLKEVVVGARVTQNNQIAYKFFIFRRNRIDFNSKGQISKVTIGPYESESGSFIKVSSPKSMTHHDNSKYSVKDFRVKEDGTFSVGNFPLQASTLVKVAVGQILPSSLL